MDMQRNITLTESTTRDNGRMTGGTAMEHCCPDGTVQTGEWEHGEFKG